MHITQFSSPAPRAADLFAVTLFLPGKLTLEDWTYSNKILRAIFRISLNKDVLSRVYILFVYGCIYGCQRLMPGPKEFHIDFHAILINQNNGEWYWKWLEATVTYECGEQFFVGECVPTSYNACIYTIQLYLHRKVFGINLINIDAHKRLHNEISSFSLLVLFGVGFWLVMA